VATVAKRSPHGERGHREQGRRTRPDDHPRRSNGNRPLTCGPSPLNNFSYFQTPLKFVNSKREPSVLKDIPTLHEARFECFEQLSPLGRLQILNIIHVINSGTEFNLNLP
jgi:hypothetical protein